MGYFISWSVVVDLFCVPHCNSFGIGKLMNSITLVPQIPVISIWKVVFTSVSSAAQNLPDRKELMIVTVEYYF